MESFPKNRKLLKNRCGGKFTELGNFGISSKEAAGPKTWENIVFFFPVLGICWTVMGKKCHRKAKATVTIFIVSQVWEIEK